MEYCSAPGKLGVHEDAAAAARRELEGEYYVRG